MGDEQTGPAKISVRSLYKIFGRNPGAVWPLLKEGKDKDTILRATGQTIGVNNVTFDVHHGEIFMVMGLSGSGKSTLIRCVNRLVEVTAGEVLIDGEDLTKMSQEELRVARRKKTGMVFQGFGLFPHRTVFDNVRYGLEVQGASMEEQRSRVNDVLEVVGLTDWAKRYPDELSGGMQQRVGLARALAPDPDILLMDEPFSALDPLIRREMQEELLDLQERLHKTILFITHDLDEALKLGDRIAIMKDGEIVQIGRPEEILLQPADDYVASFVEDVDRSKVLQASDVMFRPDAMARVGHAPRIALRAMEKEGISSLFVTGQGNRLEGIVTVDAAIEAAKSGDKDLSRILITDVPTTTADTPLRDLIPLAVRAPYPIAVVDDDKRLLGIIVRVSVLKGLVDMDDEEDAAAGAASATEEVAFET